jgi:hypothetical protein
MPSPIDTLPDWLDNGPMRRKKSGLLVLRGMNDLLNGLLNDMQTLTQLAS